MSTHKITVGDCEIVSLTDAPMEFPWSIPFPNISEADRDSYRDLYPYCYGERGFRTDAGSYVIRSAGKTIIVDTGLGPGPIAMLGGLQGTLIENMVSKGIAPQDIDIVVHTHLHFDHVSWNLTGGQPTFPNATYYASEGDLAYFEANPAANPQLASVLPLRDMGRLKTYTGETSLTQHVTTFPTPGHTPGHHSVLIASGGEKAIVTGDVAHHPMQVDHPEWSPAFDVDPQASAATRKAMVERMETEGIIAAFCHFPAEFGRITRSGNRRIFQGPLETTRWAVLTPRVVAFYPALQRHRALQVALARPRG